MSKNTRKNAKSVQRNPVVRKEYSYELNGVTLDFTLRQDTKTEMSAFIKLLESALTDVRADVE